MAIEAIRTFVRLSDALATAGQPSEEQIRELATAGFEVIVNLGMLDPRYCLADERGLAESLGVAYYHIPFNFQAPRFENLASFFDAMVATRDKKTFVHCAANDRVSAFIALYGQVRFGGRSTKPTLTSNGSGTRTIRGSNSSTNHAGSSQPFHTWSPTHRPDEPYRLWQRAHSLRGWVPCHDEVGRCVVALSPSGRALLDRRKALPQ